MLCFTWYSLSFLRIISTLNQREDQSRKNANTSNDILFTCTCPEVIALLLKNNNKNLLLIRQSHEQLFFLNNGGLV